MEMHMDVPKKTINTFMTILDVIEMIIKSK